MPRRARPESLLISLPDAAALCACGESSIREAITAGELHWLRTGPKKGYRVWREELVRWLKSRQLPKPQVPGKICRMDAMREWAIAKEIDPEGVPSFAVDQRRRNRCRKPKSA